MQEPLSECVCLKDQPLEGLNVDIPAAHNYDDLFALLHLLSLEEGSNRDTRGSFHNQAMVLKDQPHGLVNLPFIDKYPLIDIVLAQRKGQRTGFNAPGCAV